MSLETAIRVEDLGKRYRLGLTHAGSIRELAAMLGARARGMLRGALSGKARNGAAGPLDASLTPNGPQEFWALRDVNFELRRGQVLGVIGANGAGKSTLLKILSQITKPTTGRAEIRGRVGSLLEVGTGFHPELTGRENVHLNGAILGMSRAEVRRKFHQIVEFAGIPEFIDTPVKRYSSGMRVRLAFAVAAHLDPEILIVDEVLAVGDAGFQQRCLGKMDDVARQGRTIMFVSHDMEAIQRLCPHAVLLSAGSIVERGKSSRVVRSYLNGFARTCASEPEFRNNSSFDHVEILVNDQTAEKLVVLDGRPLRITVAARTPSPRPCPRIDLSFYRNDGLKLFSVLGDRLLTIDPTQKKKRWTLDFSISPLSLASQDLYCDIGLREYQSGSYSVLWDRAVRFTVDGNGAAPYIASSSVMRPEVAARISGS